MPATQVQVTSWRWQSELVAVKDAFYNPTSSAAARKHACETVQVWELLGNVPHAVVATAELTAALLFDTEDDGSDSSNNAVSSQIRLGVYMSAWTRFVDGMTDSQQIYRGKRNMYEVARDLGMPSAFVELRHRAVHERKPMLHEFRREVRAGLAWLFAWFWAYVQPETDDDDDHGNASEDETMRDDVVVSGDGDHAHLTGLFRDQLATYGDALVEEATAKGKKRKPSNMRNPLVESIALLCADDDDKWRALASAVASTLPLVTPLASQKPKQKPGRAVKLAIEDLNGLDPILLGLSQRMPSFVALLDETLTLQVAVPAPEQLDSLRDSATALLLHMHLSEPWRQYHEMGLLNGEVLREACAERPNYWTEQVLASLEREG